MSKNRAQQKKGIIIVNVLILGTIAIIATGAFVAWASMLFKNARLLDAKEQAFQIAEAGIDYYRWHLAHASSDYTDGTGGPGPYVHDFRDKDGNVIGQFSLTITPPPSGSTIVRIRSKGTVGTTTGVSRTIEAALAIPSFAKYAVVANDVMRFGVGTEVFGPIHSNNGIRFDGLAHNLITSAKDKYVDPDNGSAQRFAVYTTVNPQDPNPPAAVPNRPDVFMSGRQFPVPAVDFTGITADFASMKAAASTSTPPSGYYRAGSGGQGYRLVLNTNDTFDLYRVNNVVSAPNNCNSDSSGWATWSIPTSGGAQTQLENDRAFPANGIIFLEDHIWIEGTINTARLTIAAATLPDNPSTRKNIIINNDLSYTNSNGSDTLGLIAQNNVLVGLRSQDDLDIDGALIAQNGRVGRYYYDNDCGTGYERETITLYGMIASNLRYGFAYTDGTGYENRNIIYDSNLLYAPPPLFPLTSDQYTIISWEEVK